MKTATRAARVCLITPSHVCRNPRLAREAAALADVGYRVSVVSAQWGRKEAEEDRVLAANEKWRLCPVTVGAVDLRGYFRWFWTGVRQRLYRRMGSLREGGVSLDKAFSRYLPELAAAAEREGADLYIAHNLPALPVAVRVARRRQVKVGFDAEDFHRGEFPEEEWDSGEARLTRTIEETYIPRCDYVTAASVGISEAYAKCLGIAPPRTLLNVFPLSDRQVPISGPERDREKPGSHFSIYWFSQTIGADRGLQDVLRALPLLPTDVHLTLRGRWNEAFRPQFWKTAEDLGVRSRVHVLDLSPPNEMVARAACHEVGLALEQPVSENRKICLSNKIMTYFAAGVAVVATATPGQRWVAEQAPGAVRLCEPGDSAGLARIVRGLYEGQDVLSEARRASSRAAEDRFNWESQRRLFLDVVGATLGEPVLRDPAAPFSGPGPRG